MQLPGEEALGILRFGDAPGKKHRVFWDFGGGGGEEVGGKNPLSRRRRLKKIIIVYKNEFRTLEGIWASMISETTLLDVYIR